MGEIRAVEQWYRMGKARNYDEWLDAVKMQALPSFNIVYADRAGTIYYLYNALMPKRADGYDWHQYLPGNTSETLWIEYEPFEKLPQVKNPSSGFVVNCNSSPCQATVGDGNPNPSDFPEKWGVESIMTNRAYRALEILGQDGPISEERFLACKYDIQYSPKSQAGELLKEIFAAPPSDDPIVEDARQAMRDWDYRVDVGNPNAAISILTLEPMVRATMFGNKAPDLMTVLKEKAHLLKDTFGKIRVPWEQVNHMRHGKFALGLAGGPDVLHAVYGKWSNGELVGEAGDSYILLAEWDQNGNVKSRSINQFGSATTRPDSPHYADQAPLFAQCQLKDSWLDEQEIRAHLEREYRPGEE
jgi:acyl-homoserine-lactone acylase